LSGTVAVTLEETIAGSDFGGDDYIEGNGGGDTIYGGLGQDDIVGGNSSLYNLNAPSLRPDGADTVFGGDGDMIDRNNAGDGLHARDADMILGDNGNIHRLVGLAFAYDNYGSLKIVVRAPVLLDYTPGGPDFSTNAGSDIGGNDILRGESGDDSMYGQMGDDVLFGDAQDDDLIGGWGHDWISGGTGDDGVLGDDGRIYTARNGTAESLYGLAATTQTTIATPGNHNIAVIFPTGLLNKTVNLTPFNVDPDVANAQDPEYDAQYADDIIFGGLGNDFLHGGPGNDAISGAEALPVAYALVFPDDDAAYELVDGKVVDVGYDALANPGQCWATRRSAAASSPSTTSSTRCAGSSSAATHSSSTSMPPSPTAPT
jgi:Ca2+-binding RTX toxin-like protein